MAFVVGVGSGRVDSRGSRSVVTCAHDTESGIGRKVSVGVFSLAAAAVLVVAPASVESAINAKFPPIDRTNPNRCEVKSSAMGQANAARDSLFDLRECNLSKMNFSGFDIAGVIMENANMSGSIFKDTVMSKAWAVGANLKGADFSNAIADRVVFNKANLEGAIFTNAVLSESSFKDANLKDTDFSDVYIGDFALRNICKNPTFGGENPTTGNPTRESLGC
ncbi:hypothetical protein NDN08_001581 [Rhodosorus marinus]|uniref:Thylakoid lumenal 17.4 kDa protein, chloroplastic n=1 Tax=Rhodosorus marinus TaxID=101924 RepID=A0AAV8UR99_9RHOD|nr:hypothetical protein NDN08_001581 [Rhodosorus marinus]